MSRPVLLPGVGGVGRPMGSGERPGDGVVGVFCVGGEEGVSGAVGWGGVLGCCGWFGGWECGFFVVVVGFEDGFVA